MNFSERKQNFERQLKEKHNGTINCIGTFTKIRC